MSTTADDAYARLKEITEQFKDFVSQHGRVSEADTRVKFIDRILKEVCCWPELAISREVHHTVGYSDYQLTIRDLPLLAVEAKREGIAFTLPTGTHARTAQLNGAMMTEAEVKNAIHQVRKYCDDGGIKFAVATNGYAWIIFRAIRDDMPWNRGRARIYPSIESIHEHFVEFWNLLSYDAISEGSLDTEFGRIPAPPRELLRVIDRLFNADLPLRRNRLNSQLQPLLKYIFEDIAGQGDLDLLNSCYVHTESLRVVARDLNTVITDALPKELEQAGTHELKQTESHAGEFGESLQVAVNRKRGELYLLLGGIGSGKTTFLKRYQKLIASAFLEHNAFVFSVDFLQAPLEAARLETFVWNAILTTLRTTYSAHDLEEPRHVKSIFREKIAAIERTALRAFRKHTEQYEQALGPHLASWQDNVADYVPKLLQFITRTNKRAAVLFADNVDQLDPEYQAQIFLLAQRVTREAGCITIVALREESYYAPSIQNTFTAYNTHKFHIASPQFRRMIGNRIEYAIRALPNIASLAGTQSDAQPFDPVAISEFLRIVQFSVLEWSDRISTFIECICFGNMRSALQMFTTFLTSGATNVDKMLSIYRRDGRYNIAFHEFVKSVMLQDRAYYKEEESPILNLFNCTSEKNSSHFTAVRILAFLLARRSEPTSEGRGYYEIAPLVGAFADVFDNVRDVSATLDRLISRQLIEANTRSTKTVKGASHLRVTAAGWYYMKQLMRTFTYLDLVLQDTPLNDVGLEHTLRQSVYDVNNLADRDNEKWARMKVRFDRTQRFLDYLSSEEARDYSLFDLRRTPPPFSQQFMLPIVEKFAEDRPHIEERLRDGRIAGDVPEPFDRLPTEFGIARQQTEATIPDDPAQGDG